MARSIEEILAAAEQFSQEEDVVETSPQADDGRLSGILAKAKQFKPVKEIPELTEAPAPSLFSQAKEFFADPAKEKAIATQAMVDSQIFGISLSDAYNKRFAIDHDAKITPERAAIRETAYSIFTKNYKTANTGLQRDYLYSQQIYDENPQRQRKIDEYNQAMAETGEIGLPESRVQDILEATGKTLPFMVNTASNGQWLGLAAGLGGFALGTATLGPEAGIPLGVEFYGAGVTTGSLMYSAQVMAGSNYRELLEFESESGEKINKGVAKFGALASGSLMGLVEVAQMKTLFKSFGGDKALAGVVSKTLANLSESGAVTQAIVRFGGVYGTTLATETKQEVQQEMIKIVGDELSKVATNYLDGKNIERATTKDVVSQLATTITESIKGLGLVSGLGPAARFGGDIAKVSTAKIDAARIEKAIADEVEQEKVIDEVVTTDEATTEAVREELQSVVDENDIQDYQNIVAQAGVIAEERVDAIFQADRDEINKRAEAEGVAIAAEDPIQQVMSSAVEQGGILLTDQIQADYGETITEIIKKRPGLFSKKGTLVLDEIAVDEAGFDTEADFINAVAEVATKKDTVAKLSPELAAEELGAVDQFEEEFRQEVLLQEETKAISELLATEKPELRAELDKIVASIPSGVSVSAIERKQLTEAFAEAKAAQRSGDDAVFQEAKDKIAGLVDKFKVDSRAIPESSYQENREAVEPTILATATRDAKDIVKQIGKGVDRYLGSISTRLANISPKLKYVLREFEFQVGVKEAEMVRASEPFFAKVQKMEKGDMADFDLARKNADTTKINELLDKYEMATEYAAVREVLNKLHADAVSVGFDIGFIEEFNPRYITDMKGFLEHFQKGDDWSVISDAIRGKEAELGHYLDFQEKAQFINSMLRGYGQGNITLSKPSVLKERKIDTITPELNKFYSTSEAALLNYIHETNSAIEARRFFGKKAKPENVGENDDTIGSFVLDLIQSGEIKAHQEKDLSDILKARFNEVGTTGVLGLYKNLSYIDTMGSVASAVTQIGDIAWSLYQNGVAYTADGVIKASTGKSAITREDIGVERIAAEFADQTKAAKAVSKVFKIIGLEKMDAIGKETLLHASWTKFKNRAKRSPAKLRKELQPIFGDRTDQLMTDLEEGTITEDVKLLMFNKLADFQPITLSEMPQKYLTGGNGRIFYMLKTFTIKSFDIYRREVFQQIANKDTRAQGITNLVRLASYFVFANATADVIKAIILNRPIEPDDLAVDNLLRLFGISKFVTWKAREEGLGVAARGQIFPPTKLINALSKDINTAGDEKGLETVSSIPVFGKLYYWWFGKGKKKSDRRRNKK